jgi:hypothetical protein
MTDKKMVEMVERVTISTNFTKTNLIIKGLSAAEAGQFKYLAKLLDLRHHEFLSLLLSEFALHNPTIIDSLQTQIVELKVISPQELRVRDTEVERAISGTRQLMADGKLTKEGMDDRLLRLRPALRRKDIPDIQKQEVAEFLAWAGEQKLRSRRDWR